ncbi:MAG: uncharacterized protein H6Q38_1097 [Chloroflexi bacterium]|nr:uncharacterized protein [Chloroflexota bacterium]
MDKTIELLILAVIQIQDADQTIDALISAGLEVTRIGSSGGFLGRRNATLLIGLAKEQQNSAIEIFRSHCRRRTEYIATRLEGSPFHLPLTTPVTVGGATIFTFPVEHYEEIP